MPAKTEGRGRMGRQRMRWLDGITDSMDKIEQTPGDGEGQGSLVCCSPWDRNESDRTEQLNKNNNGKILVLLIDMVSLFKWISTP